MNIEEAIKKVATEHQLDEALVQSLTAVMLEGIDAKVKEQLEEQKASIDEIVAAKLISEKAALEEGVKTAVDEFITENQQTFINAKRYEQMEQLVEGLRSSFAQYGIEVEYLDERVQEKANVEALEEENKTLKAQIEEQKCSAYLIQALNESQISDMGKDKVLNLLKYTAPKTLDEFKSVADALIAEQKKAMKEDTKEDDADKKDDDKTDDKSKTADESKGINMNSLVEAMKRFA
jgi:hypothetical protein